MKTAILYYSRTGNTREIAKILEEKLKDNKADVDLIEIEAEKKPGFFKAGRASMKRIDLPITNTDFNLKKYDMIIIGSPTWAGHPAPLYSTFLKKAENIEGKKTAIFSIGASPLEKRDRVVDFFKNDLESLGMSIPKATLAIQMDKGAIRDGEQHIDEFIGVVLKK